MKKILALVVLILVLSSKVYGAATDFGPTFGQVITVAVGSAIQITVPNSNVTIVHLNRQSDGTTASVAGDYVVVMNASDTMVASFADGFKIPILAGGSCTINGNDVKELTGVKTIQIQAVGNSAKVLILRGK